MGAVNSLNLTFGPWCRRVLGEAAKNRRAWGELAVRLSVRDQVIVELPDSHGLMVEIWSQMQPRLIKRKQLSFS